MPYPQRLLNDGEEVALDIHPHWWFFAKSAAATLFTSVLFLWSAVALGDATWEKSLKWLFGATAIVSLIWLAVRWLAWRTTHFVITSDRLIARKGIIAKSGIEIPLERVNNVSFNQSIFERSSRPVTCSSSRAAKTDNSDSPTSCVLTRSRT